MLLPTRIRRLKQLLVSAEDLTHPLRYYIEKVAPDPDLAQASQPDDPLFLRLILQGIAHLHFDADMPLTSPAFSHAAAYHLWRGDCRLGPYNAHVLYFGDLDVGLVSIHRLPASHEVELLRFSVVRRKSSGELN